MALLTHDERTALIGALIASGLDVPGTRQALLRGSIDPLLLAVMPVSPVPAVQLMTDIGKLNMVERLPGGELPLEIYLRNVDLLLAGSAAEQRVVRTMLSRLTQRATGAPQLDPATLPETKERLIHDTDDTVSFAFMEAGLRAGSSVMKLRVPRHENGQPRLHKEQPVIYLGTGWLLEQTLVMTNHHVVNAREDGEPHATEADLRKQAEGTRVQFDFDFDGAQGLDVNVLALEAWDVTLDYALLRIAPISRPSLVRAPQRLQVGKETVSVNIIQHPRGHSKRYGIRNNLVSASNATDLRYFTDTESGSSGSPVCNDRWEVVALHRGSAYVEGVQFQGKSTAYVNVGTHLSAILEDLQKRFPALVVEIGVGQ